jgi:hypothetical protein
MAERALTELSLGVTAVKARAAEVGAFASTVATRKR